MTQFQYISSDIDRIKLEVRIGLIPCTLLRHIQIYCRYDYYRKQGEKVDQAVFYASLDLKATERYVYKIKKRMEAEIETN
jgi:hypothetical protein